MCARAARSTASASSTLRSVRPAAELGRREPADGGGAELVGQPAYSSGSATARGLGGAAGERPHARFARGRCRRRSPSGRRRTRARRGRALAGVGEALDRALVDADLAPDRAPRPRPRRRPAPASSAASTARRRAPASRSSARVTPPSRPPSARGCRTCGWPTPAATLWPALPQNPVAISRSSAIPSIAAQRLEPVADQRRAAHRRGHPAVLDQVALGDAEDEVAGRRLDLAAAERDRVEAALDARDQLLRRGRRPGRSRCWSSAAPAGGGTTRGGRCRSRRRRPCAPAAGRRGTRSARPSSMIVVRWVGAPSSSIPSLPHSPGRRPSS